jgi:hypothetical protein
MNISHLYGTLREIPGAFIYPLKQDGLVVIRTRDLRRVKATS